MRSALVWIALAGMALLMSGCDRPLDLAPASPPMPGAEDASHPAERGNPAMTRKADPGTAEGLWTNFMTFPDSPGGK